MWLEHMLWAGHMLWLGHGRPVLPGVAGEDRSVSVHKWSAHRWLAHKWSVHR